MPLHDVRHRLDDLEISRLLTCDIRKVRHRLDDLEIIIRMIC